MSKENFPAQEMQFSTEYTGASVMPVRISGELCIGCGRCVNACQIDVFLPPETPGAPPLVFYPGECWYCGACVMECPVPGAITLRHPLMNQAKFVEKKLS